MTRGFRAALIAAATIILASCSGDAPLAHQSDGAAGPQSFRTVTFNTGTPQCSRAPDAKYSCDDADTSSAWYGTGLAHLGLMADVRAFFDGLDADIVAIQEIFHAPNCLEIPEAHHPGFICEQWQPGDETVITRVLGPDYQVACHRGRPDKCLAVRTDVGRFRGCNDRFCPDLLAGGITEECGGGTRIGRGVIDLANGEVLTVVNVHGTSGATLEDQNCRVEQFEQVFVDIRDGSGMPAANGLRNVVLGDLNTDPGRLTLIDASARTWNAFVGEGRAFVQISETGLLARPTYANLLNIDHVASDAFDGDCFAGVPTETTAFDHVPIVCDLSPRGAAASAVP